tara:strand:+ start:469 stop:873 length:405 start_codon:yes stop_codon:yes gene_type:complete
MLELLKTTAGFLHELLLSIWGLLCLVAGFGSEVLVSLHTEAPRLEGLLVGIALAWLMLRRDKHPLLRVLSAPLKLVLDILDLAWDQCVEVVKDGWGVVFGWVKKSWGLAADTVKGAWNKVLSLLKNIKGKLSKD